MKRKRHGAATQSRARSRQVRVVKHTGPTVSRSTNRAWSILSAVVPQAVLVSAVLYYFGWTFTNSYFSYFGVDVRQLGYSTSDYILRSILAVYAPALVTLTTVLILLVLHIVVVPRLLNSVRWSRYFRHVAVLFLAAGAVAVVIPLAITACIGLSAGKRIFIPLGLVGGLALLGYAMYLWQRCSQLGIGTQCIDDGSLLLFKLVAVILAFLCSLWAIGIYGDNHGREDARYYSEHLASEQSIVVFSVGVLDIRGHGVQVSPLPNSSGKYHYVYSGLAILSRSSDRYFLLPHGWVSWQDRVFVIRDNDDIRVDFEAATDNR
jgi:hypothetical protein